MSKELEDIEQLAEYDSDDEQVADAAAAAASDAKQAGKDTYVGVHSSGFRELLLRPELLRAIVDCGFEHPSEVQHECIPEAILGNDVLCQAKSGMGKQLDIKAGGDYPGVQTLVLCHTRELAFQICHEFDRFKKYLPEVKTAVFYGGIPVEKNVATLRGDDKPHVVIGTPGRIMDLTERKDLDLSKLKQFVLDECDKLLEQLDMRRTVQQIFRATPHEKQVMMFSATLSDEVRPVCKKFMHNPHEIYVNEGAKLTLHGLQQYYVQLEEAGKNRKLVDLLDALEFNQLIIFTKSVSRCKALNKLLVDCNFPSIAIHGSMKQEERIALYKKFKDFSARIMVSTNLLGRGIDVERVNVVINYDCPESADTYLHRVGRAGRFGTKGLAITFISEKEDGEVLNEVQSRFVVSIPELPDNIDSSTYMTN